MSNRTSRRSFLQKAPAAAIAGLAITELAVHRAASAQIPTPEPFQVFTAQTIASILQALETKPGNTDLFKTPRLPFALTYTTEQKKAAKEFEYHEGRHHLIHILEGSTVYELGGTPQNPRSTGPGEWLAPSSTGSTTITLHKGDMVTIPLGTPHRRTTADSVTLTLIAIMATHA
jgi:mannose-6-phosphate isomerase-like protein (cupin superfamily)